MVSICRIYTQTFVHVGLISGASRFAVWSKGGGGRAGKRQFPRFQGMEKSEEEIKKKKNERNVAETPSPHFPRIPGAAFGIWKTKCRGNPKTHAYPSLFLSLSEAAAFGSCSSSPHAEVLNGTASCRTPTLLSIKVQVKHQAAADLSSTRALQPDRASKQMS